MSHRKTASTPFVPSLLVALTLTSCGGGGSESTTPPATLEPSTVAATTSTASVDATYTPSLTLAEKAAQCAAKGMYWTVIGEASATPYCGKVLPMGLYVGEEPTFNGRTMTEITPILTSDEACYTIGGTCWRKESEKGNLVYQETGYKDWLFPRFKTFLIGSTANLWTWSNGTVLLRDQGIGHSGNPDQKYSVIGGAGKVMYFKGTQDGIELYQEGHPLDECAELYRIPKDSVSPPHPFDTWAMRTIKCTP